MKDMKRATAALVILYLFIFLGGAALADPAKVSRTKLPNGLTVVIEEEHSAPVVSVQMWVKVGSADEPEKLAGISHVFEHMLFKGTDKRGVGQIATMIESVGGDINAYTSFDNTVYHLTVPSRYFGTGLDVISDAIQHSSFDPDELAKELEVVLEEIRMNEDNPGRKLFKSLLRTAYTTHTYGRPVIGYVDTVKSFTRKDILSFFKKWYVPNNMVLVIVGDVEKDEALKAVKDAFKGFKAAPDPHRKRPVEPKQNKMRSTVFDMQVQDAQLGMTFHIPTVKDEDTYAIDVMESILSGGETSRLYKKLKIEDELVHGISAYSMSLKNPGLFFITSMLKPENVGSALTGSLEIIGKLAAQGPDHEELQRAKFNMESSFVYSRETMDGLAGKLGFFEVNLGDYAFEKKYIDNIRKVTNEDVKRVTARYLNPANMTVSVLMPEGRKGEVTKDSLAESVKASETLALRAKKEEAAEGRTTRTVLENGMTLVVKEVSSNPTVAFYAALPGGLRFEDKEKNGVGGFTAQMLTRGTVKMTREELSKELEDMAGGVEGFSGWNSTGASGKFLSMFFDKGLATLADILMNPVFPEKEIEKLRADTLAAIARQEDNLPGYTFKLLYRELYDVHPYGMQTIGTKESITALTREDLIAHHKAFFVPDRMVLTIVGDVDADYAAAKVSELFADFKRVSAALPYPPVDTPETSVERTGATKDKEQTHIGIGFNGTTIGNEDSYPLRVMSEVLSGQGGRLFIELRDKKSLAYTVSAFSREAVDPGLIAGYIATAPEKKDEALKGLLEEFRKLREEPVVSEEELARAKSSIIGNYEIGLQSVSSQAADMANNELFGLGYAFSEVYPEKIQAVTAEDVMRVAKKYLDLDAYVLSIVGPNGEAHKTE